MVVRERFRPFPVLAHRTIQRNVVVFVLAFPATGLLVFLLLNPFSSTNPLLRDEYRSDAIGRNLQLLSVQEKERAGTDSGKNYTIHIWMHGERMKRRFLRSYGNARRDPYEFCSVRNCKLTTDDSDVANADAVMFHLHQTRGPHELPEEHPPHQIWIFFTDESPYHTFYASKRYGMSDYDGLFNWSMTYRGDSDVPVPYGRTVPLTPEEKRAAASLSGDIAKTKVGTVAILGSNCGGQNGRWDYVRELRDHVQVDVYGSCGDLKCPGHFTRDCPSLALYKFYLAFENSNCREYITEKLWWNAYHNDAVPIVMGAPRRDYERLCPPGSFIHVDDFRSPAELAAYIRYLDGNDTAYNQYFLWKKQYKVLNEHGYFGSPSLHLCRICERLNSKPVLPKIYEHLALFWNKKRDCPPVSKYPKISS